MDDLKPKKSLGQHFLRDANIARKIVDSLGAGPDDPVVEIGPGTGALTVLLAEKFGTVTAVEVDPRAAAVIRERYPSVSVLHEDVLSVDWGRLAAPPKGPLYVIGNLPYNITSQILFSLIESRHSIAEAVVMTQLEVARRIAAAPGSKAYGILSVAVQLAGSPKLLFTVSRNVFRPRPDVQSAVMRIDFRHAPLLAGVSDEAWIRTVVRAAFNQRRKTLRNSLGELASMCGRELPGAVASKRAEELSPEDFVELARYLQSGS